LDWQPKDQNPPPRLRLDPITRIFRVISFDIPGNQLRTDGMDQPSLTHRSPLWLPIQSKLLPGIYWRLPLRINKAQLVVGDYLKLKLQQIIQIKVNFYAAILNITWIVVFVVHILFTAISVRYGIMIKIAIARLGHCNVLFLLKNMEFSLLKSTFFYILNIKIPAPSAQLFWYLTHWYTLIKWGNTSRIFLHTYYQHHSDKIIFEIYTLFCWNV